MCDHQFCFGIIGDDQHIIMARTEKLVKTAAKKLLKRKTRKRLLLDRCEKAVIPTSHLRVVRIARGELDDEINVVHFELRGDMIRTTYYSFS